MINYDEMIPRLLRVGAAGDWEALCDAFALCVALEKEGAAQVILRPSEEQVVHDPVNFDKAHGWAKQIRAESAKAAKNGGGAKMVELNKKCLLFDAPYDFDAAIRYAEYNRPFEKKFYEPRRKQLLPAVQALQDLADRKVHLTLLMMPPGAGKTGLELMFLRWYGGRFPELSNLVGSHSGSILQGMYGELQRMCDPEGEYLWNEIFPSAPLVSTDAKNLQMSLKKARRFPTYQFASVGAGNAGRVRASGLLCLDDLVPDLESAMSRERMDKLWNQYNTDYLQRTIGDCVQLLIQTPWSLHDPIDRLADMHEDDPDCRIIRLPALDENDESNFDYPNGLGFSTEKYHNLREIMDDASWRALYQLTPVERDGMLYDPSELRRYFELPDREPDAVISVCDIADGGGDYWAMPIVYQYGNDFYIEDWVCDNGKPEYVEAKIIDKLVKHKVKLSRFESNRGGGRVAESVQKAIKERGGITKITTKWNETAKDTRIIINSPWIKSHCLFKSENLYDREYRSAMNMLSGYTMAGKNKHDDIADSMSMLAEFVQSFEMNTVSIVKRPF